MKPPALTTNSEVQALWWSSPGILYFFAAGNPPSAIKIGVAAQTQKCSLSTAVMRRFTQIQTSNHETVELLGVITFSEGQFPTRDAEVLERELHIRFADLQRFKPHTRGAEWFTPSEELGKYISSFSTPPEELDLPRFACIPINRPAPTLDSKAVALATVSAEQGAAANP